MNSHEDDVLRQLREIVERSPFAAGHRAPRPTSPNVPCLFTMPLNGPDRVEWCRIDAGRPHRIHVSAHGVYRWNDNGEPVPTPHVASPFFRALYETDPDGQFIWLPPAAPDGPVSVENRPEDHRTGFRRFADTWKLYGALPAFQRRVRRTGLTAGFVLGLIVTVAAIAAVVLAILVLTWFCLAWFSGWLAR